MGFLQNLFKKLAAPPKTHVNYFYAFKVRCKRCGEVVEGRLNLNNDLSIDYEDGTNYVSRKVLIGGSNLCFQQIETIFKFSGEKKLLSREIIGGEFVEEE